MALPVLAGLAPLAIDVGSKLIDRWFPDPKEAAARKAELFQMQQDGELKELETRMSAILAEAKSSDPWTSRARPSFMYVIYIMILSAIPIGILSIFSPSSAHTIIQGTQSWLSSIPTEMWTTFTVGYVGYTAGRTFEKRAIIQGKTGPLAKFKDLVE